jgi:hypothetical protein
MHARSLRTTAPVALAAFLFASSLAVAAAAPAGAAAPSVTTSRFAAPSALVSVGPWIVVANQSTSSLTILTASGGTFVREVSHSLLGVASPTSIVATTVAGRRLAFVGADGGRIAELRFGMSGTTLVVARVGILQLHGCAGRAATYLATDTHGHLVAACSTGAVAVWSMWAGRLLRVIPSSTTHLTGIGGLAVLGATAYLTNAATTAEGSAPDGVTAFSLATGRRLLTVTNATNPAYTFSTPAGISTDGANLWVANEKGNTIDWLARGTLGLLGSSSTNLTAPAVVLATPKFTWVSSASVNGSSSMVTQFYVVGHAIASTWMMCNSNGPYQFGDPSGFTMHGGMLWVANASDDLVDQMNGTTGALVGTYT